MDRQLKEHLRSVVSDHPERKSIQHVVRTCQVLSRSYLRAKARSGAIPADLFGLSLDDLALDCFADLLARGGQMRFTELRGYFRDIDWETVDEAELFMSLRRLVFSKVNNSIYRRYRDADPGLARIVRNIKLCVRDRAGFVLVRRGRRQWVVVANQGALKSLPTASPELVERWMMAALRTSTDTPHLMEVYRDCIHAHPYYTNGYPLTGLALAIRSALTRLYAEELEDESAEPAGYTAYEIEQAIEYALQQVRSAMYSTYVESGKVETHTFTLYIRAIRLILASDYISHTSPAGSYYEALAAHMQHLTKTRYHQQHRNVIEYLVKKARAEMVGYLRRDRRLARQQARG